MRRGFAFAALLALGAASARAAPPKLIVAVVVDQFRADVLSRLEGRFLPAESGGKVGGLRYLMDRGAFYPYAEYDILQSMTGPGHATILTGAYPYQMGIPLNDWWDHGTKQRVYCAEDREHATVGATPATPHIGTSPRNLIGTTFGDELKFAGRPSKVVAIAGKDRSAILLGGRRADLALWFDVGEFQWASSRYYLPDGKLPAWVERMSSELSMRRGEKLVFDKRGPGLGVSLADPMILLDGGNAGKVGATWPHEARVGSKGALALPFALDLVETAAERAIDELGLGRGGGTDVLAVSFSSYDYLAHIFGPNSREMEEMTVALDRSVSRLLNHVRARVPGGLRDVLIVMTGDHGGPPNPDWLRSVRVDAGRFDHAALIRRINERLGEKYGKPDSGAWVLHETDLNFYLNRDEIARRKLDPVAVEEETKEALRSVPGVAHVFSLSDYRARRLPPGMHERQILRTYFPGRSGDVVVIPRPFHMGEGDTTNHMTGYTFDRMVPLALAGPGIRPGRHAVRAEVVDIARTLSWLVGVVPPPLAEGRVLVEALK
jgi:hypothetical protein